MSAPPPASVPKPPPPLCLCPVQVSSPVSPWSWIGVPEAYTVRLPGFAVNDLRWQELVVLLRSLRSLGSAGRGVSALCAPVDMRCGFEGLWAWPHQFKWATTCSPVICFLSGQDCRRAKVLFFDGTGQVCYA